MHLNVFVTAVPSVWNALSCTVCLWIPSVPLRLTSQILSIQSLLWSFSTQEIWPLLLPAPLLDPGHAVDMTWWDLLVHFPCRLCSPWKTLSCLPLDHQPMLMLLQGSEQCLPHGRNNEHLLNGLTQSLSSTSQIHHPPGVSWSPSSVNSWLSSCPPSSCSSLINYPPIQSSNMETGESSLKPLLIVCIYTSQTTMRIYWFDLLNVTFICPFFSLHISNFSQWMMHV